MDEELKSGPYQHEGGALDGRWDWRLVIGGDIVATSHNQGYENRGECQEKYQRVCSGYYWPQVSGRE